MFFVIVISYGPCVACVAVTVAVRVGLTHFAWDIFAKLAICGHMAILMNYGHRYAFAPNLRQAGVGKDLFL